MFQRKIDELFHRQCNVFVIDDILIAGINKLGRQYNEMIDKVLKIYRKANSETQQKQKPFQIHQHSLLWGSHIMRQYKL